MKINFRVCDIKKSFFLGDDSKKLVSTLGTKLKETKLKVKSSQINDSPNEYDIINNFIIYDDYIIGSVIRLTTKNKILEFNNALFDLEKITTSEISHKEMNSEHIVKDCYYFLISEKYAILTIDRNLSVIKFQNYLNWLLSDSHTSYLISDRLLKQEDIDLSINNIQKIKFKDPLISNKEIDKSFLTSVKDKFIDLFNDTTSMENLEFEHYFDFNLTLTPSKGNNSKQSLKSLFRIISDEDNIELITKDGIRINGKNIKDITVLDIEDDNGTYIEEDIYNKLSEKFDELIKNEDQ